MAVVVERALDALVAKLEKERLGKTARPQKKPRAANPARVRQAVRRAVFERDGERCTFVDAEGRRCSATGFLELDHAHSRALGGSSDVPNLAVMCRGHNRLHAEEVFGKDHVARLIHLRQRRQRKQRESSCGTTTTTDIATRGVVNMGFREPDVRRALEELASGQSGAETPPVEDVLRRALAMLT